MMAREYRQPHREGKARAHSGKDRRVIRIRTLTRSYTCQLMPKPSPLLRDDRALAHAARVAGLPLPAQARAAGHRGTPADS